MRLLHWIGLACALAGGVTAQPTPASDLRRAAKRVELDEQVLLKTEPGWAEWVAKELRNNAACFEALQRGLRSEAPCRFANERLEVGQVSRLREVLTLRAEYKLAQEDWGGAVEAAADLLRFGARLRSEGSFLDGLYAISCEATGLAITQQALAGSPASKALRVQVANLPQPPTKIGDLFPGEAAFQAKTPAFTETTRSALKRAAELWPEVDALPTESIAAHVDELALRESPHVSAVLQSLREILTRQRATHARWRELTNR